jgi:poly-beta-1,6-N-acetyl-D-glucosamine synthase
MSSLTTNAVTEFSRNQSSRYVLMTAAYNEEETIERTIKSMVSQTIVPERWVIVSDGSSDRTDDIIQEYAGRFSFIRYLRITRLPGRSFGSKVRALHSGTSLLAGIPYAFIGNVDADVSLEPSYFQELIAAFNRRSRLGIAGGFFFEEEAGEFRSRRGNHTYSVTHAAQLVRRECYEAIGGYAVLEFGGEDWHAETSAKMNGWEIEAFPELKIFHHRHTGEGGNLLRYKFRQGRMDHSFGCDPLFEVLKCLLRVPDKPFFVGCVARLTGFAWSWAHRDRRLVSNEFMAFLRNEQKARVRSLFKIKGKFSRKRIPTISPNNR